MPRKPLNIENLLEQMGSQELPGDPEHRYELRRRILCSRFFEDSCVRSSKWDRLLTYTVPLFAGGMMVGVLTLVAVYSPIEAEVGPQTGASSIEVVQLTPVKTMDVAPIVVSDFLSDPKEPTVKLADFTVAEEKQSVRFIPLDHQYYVRTQ